MPKRLLHTAHKHARMLWHIRCQADQDEAVGIFVDELNGSVQYRLQQLQHLPPLGLGFPVVSYMDLDEEEETRYLRRLRTLYVPQNGMLGTELGSEFTDECGSEFAAKGGSRLLSQSCGIHELCEFASECGTDFRTDFTSNSPS
ncbi:hypothetical protein JB92DRAFT_3096698 [Gautieria morchelliformis]|nr:hypothetical protein JB92DRAFT_3096698 [Gautieria morchelliformis]